MRNTKTRIGAGLAAVASATLLLASCSGGGGEGDSSAAPEEVVTLTFANSYADDHPHNRCGAALIAEEINAMDIGLDIELFTNSQLGGDLDRFTSLMEGDIDIDMQGSSGISSTYPAIGPVDSAFAFRDADHLFSFFDGDESSVLKDGLLEATGVRVLDPYYFGSRTFSANSPIRTPEDLEGLQMRFPDSPVHLANAEALGATAVAVAFEELFIALQQGVADGQENPVPTVKSLSLDEVQSHVSLDNHLVGFQLVVINEDTWQSLSEEQQTALTDVIHEVRAGDRECIEEETQSILDEWEANGPVTVVEDVDREAFEERAEEYFLDYWTGEDLELYKAIRESAG